MNFKSRINKLRELLEKNKNGFLVTDPDDIIYYTGYKPSSLSFLLVTGKDSTLFVSPLDNEAKLLEIDVVFAEKKAFRSLKGKVYGFDETHMPARAFLNLRKIGLRLKQSADAIKKPRCIKDIEEIELIKKAIGITKASQPTSFAGKSEDSVAKEIEASFKMKGADIAFETIVASGKNSQYIHHIPDSKRIGKAENVLVDSGARYKNYCADITRMYGKSKMIDDMVLVQNRIIDHISTGMTMKQVQEFYSKQMKKLGYKVYHLFGHGLGISVHETISGELENNMILTVEPGAYTGSDGARIEDVVLVKNNKARLLSR